MKPRAHLTYISRTVIVLGAISLFTDAATEMLYPVLPIYLRQIGFSILAIAWLDALAEFTAAILKAVSGMLSDRIGRRNIFVQVGYSLSALAKPLLGLTSSPVLVFALRTADRAGKGIRSAPRDALLVAASDSRVRGRVFGIHRALDTTGAVVGPAIALFLIEKIGASLSSVFLLAAVPGVLAICATFFLPKEKNVQHKPSSPKIGFVEGVNFLKTAPAPYRLLLLGFTFLALINSSDLFILLRQSEAGMSTFHVVGAYCLSNLTYALLAFPAGFLADRFGCSLIYIYGLVTLAICYAFFALPLGVGSFLLVMCLYGSYAASTEGIAKAWLSYHIPKGYEATGMGIFQAFSSIALLVASPLMGLLWEWYGARVPFLVVSLGTLLISFYFLGIRRKCPSRRVLVVATDEK